MSDRLSTITGKRQRSIPKAVVEALQRTRGDQRVFTVRLGRLIATPVHQGGR